MAKFIKKIDTIQQPGFTFKNGEAESSTYLYNLYKDAAQATPEDGNGGTPVYLTKSLNTATPLIGKGSILFSKTDGNAQGEGFSLDFTIDRGQTTSYVQTEFVYQTAAAYTDGDIQIFLYDITNTSYIPISAYIVPSTYNSPSKFVTTFIPTSSNKYRLIFHITVTTSTAWTFLIDNVVIGNKNVAVGACISEWQQFPMSITASSNPTKGTTTIDYARWRRVGSNMEISYKYRQNGAGLSGSGTYNFNLPAGYTIDLTKASVDSILNGSSFASVSADERGSTTKTGIVKVASLTTVYLQLQSDNTLNSTIVVGNSSFALGNPLLAYDFVCSVPISTWTSNVNLANDFTEYVYNTSTTDTNDTTSFARGIEGGRFPNRSVGTNVRKRIRFERPMQPGDNYTFDIYIGGDWLPFDRRIAAPTIQGVYAYGITFEEVAGSKTDLDVVFASGGARAASSTYSSPGEPWSGFYAGGYLWRVRKVSNGNMAEVPPLVYAEYINGAAVAVNNPENYQTKVEDTHNAVTTGAAWKFTTPISGRYVVTGTIISSATAPQNIVLYKNGSVFRYLVAAPNDSSFRVNYYCTIKLTAGDYIDIRSEQTGGISANSATFIQITRIGS